MLNSFSSIKCVIGIFEFNRKNSFIDKFFDRRAYFQAPAGVFWRGNARQRRGAGRLLSKSAGGGARQTPGRPRGLNSSIQHHSALVVVESILYWMTMMEFFLLWKQARKDVHRKLLMKCLFVELHENFVSALNVHGHVILFESWMLVKNKMWNQLCL